MADIEAYVKMSCPFCRRAVALLRDRGIEPTLYEVNLNPDLREIMIKRAEGRTTVPQIFINGRHIGGCDDLMALDDQGNLDQLLNSDDTKV